ncbi:MAG: 5,6-dimethylbenzimidazole synthase, partial [Candidatus Eremiobacteraeota bacterium]|nr:5,6-dimethylbenzimidazole synthase [Candidatus Eremiobacteraeota bacterium]
MATEPKFDDAFRRKLHQLFEWRRDVRHFRPDPVPGELVEELVHEAALSPSVGFAQPWRFVRVDEPARRQVVIDSFERSNARAIDSYENEDAARYVRLKLAGLREAPVHLAVFCDESTQTGKGLGRQSMPEMLAYSSANAVYTVWLAAR